MIQKNISFETPILALKEIFSSKKFWIAALPSLLWILALYILGTQEAGKSILKKWDLHLGYWILITSVLSIAGFLIYFFKDLVQYFKKLNIPLWLVILGTLLTGIATYDASHFINAQHRVQSDESVFLSTAQNMYYHFKSGSCDQGFFDEKGLNCIADASNFKARGMSVLIQLGMPFFGKDLHWIFTAQLLLFFLSGLAVIWSVWVWTKNDFLTLVMLGFYLFTPTIMFQFRSASVEPLYVLLSFLSLGFFHWATQHSQNKLKWIFIGLFLGFFAQTRQETLFCLFAFIFPAFIFIFKSSSTESEKSLQSQYFIGALTFALTPVLITISSFQGYDFQGGQNTAHGHFIENIKINWDLMTQTWPWDEMKNPFLGIFTYLSLAGLISILVAAFYNKKVRTWVYFLVLYHIQTYMILENISGDFTIEINQRYALVFLPSMAFVVAFLFWEILITYLPRILNLHKPQIHPHGLKIVALVLVVIAFSLTWKHRDALTQNVMYKNNHLSTEDTEIHKWLKTQTGLENSLWIYSRPWHFTGYHMSALHYETWKGYTPEVQSQLLEKYQGRVFYVRGLDCWDVNTFHEKAIESRNSKMCDEMEARFPMKLIMNTTITNNYELKISQLLGATPVLQAPPSLEGGAQWLTNLKPLDFVQTWQQPNPNKSINGNTLRVAGQNFAVGIGAHAYSKIRFIIPPGFKSFSTQFGIDDEEPGSDGVQFSLYVNSKLMHQSPNLLPGTIQKAIISVQAGDTLILQADSLGTQGFDHADWIEPQLFP